jgi:4-hydroxy-2-oxoheptanedioate aldolase
MDWHNLGWMCHAFRGLGIAPIVRIPRPDPFEACRVLDMGARGIVAAYVETAEQVQLLRGAVKCRPLKGRKLEQLLSGKTPLEGEMVEYVRNYNQNHVLLVNIESVPASRTWTRSWPFPVWMVCCLGRMISPAASECRNSTTIHALKKLCTS